MRFHTEILTREQAEALSAAGPALTDMGFYLGGGTAIALYLGHRRSVDLDWFRSRFPDEPLLLAESIRSAGVPLELTDVAPGTLHGAIKGVDVSLFGYDYPVLAPAMSVAEIHCEIASARDLAAMKLSAMTQRGSRKDFLDIYALGTRCFSIAHMLDSYCQKFGIRDAAHLLYALTYFADADAEPMPVLLWDDLSWEDVKETIRNWVREIMG